MTDAYDVVILGSGIAGLAGALAAHEHGLKPVVLEKASLLGGGTVNSYGLIWVGQNHLGTAAGHDDNREDVIAYMRFRVVRGLTDHYFGTAPGTRAVGRSLEVELISGYDLLDALDPLEHDRAA